eukprot:scaffold183340_cov16-Tisochrysis_lutea.AAC.2
MHDQVDWRMRFKQTSHHDCANRCTECHFVLVHRLAEPCREKCHFGAFGANSLMARLALVCWGHPHPGIPGVPNKQ